MSTQPGYFKVLLDPIARNYVVTIIGSVLALFVVQLFTASMVASIITTVLAAVTLLLQKRSLTLVMLPLIAYLQLFPNGLPISSDPRFRTAETHFRLMDLALVAAALVYVFSQLRFFSLASLAVPEGVGGTPTSLADRRSPSLMTESELTKLFMSVGVLVLTGQFIWVLVAELRLQFDRQPLITIRDAKPAVDEKDSRYPSAAASRMMLLGLVVGVPAVCGGFIVWLRRARTLSNDEAAMYLTDLGWHEMRREAARQETWRASAIPKPTPVKKPKAKRTQKNWSFEKLVLRWTIMIILALFVAIPITVVISAWRNSNIP